MHKNLRASLLASALVSRDVLHLGLLRSKWEKKL